MILGGRRTRYAKWALSAALGLGIIYTLWRSSLPENFQESQVGTKSGVQDQDVAAKEEIVIAVVVCGMRVDETLTMLKSALLFNTDKNPLRFVIVTEDALMDRFREKVGDRE